MLNNSSTAQPSWLHHVRLSIPPAHHLLRNHPHRQHPLFRTWEVAKQLGESFNHCSMHCHGKLREFVISDEVGNSSCREGVLDSPDTCRSRILANAAAKFKPECDCARSTGSRSVATGTPSFSKWTVTAIYALWFGMSMRRSQSSAPLCVPGNLQW